MQLKPVRDEMIEREFSLEPDTLQSIEGMSIQDVPVREAFFPQLDAQRVFTEAQAKCFIRDAAEGLSYREAHGAFMHWLLLLLFTGQ